MATELEKNQETNTIHKGDKDRKIQNFPDYLRFVARKSRAGFDKVHEELTKLYTSEHKLQRQTTDLGSESSRDLVSRDTGEVSHGIDLRNTLKSHKKATTRLSLRKQWTRNVKTSTMWKSAGTGLAIGGSFISYIDEDSDNAGKQSASGIDIEQLKEELKPRSKSSAENSPPSEVISVHKSLSANQTRKDKSVFTFENLRASRSLDDVTKTAHGVESDHDYINVNEYRRTANSAGKLTDTSENHYDVPRSAVQLLDKARPKVTGNGPNGCSAIPKGVPAKCGKSAKNTYVNDSNPNTNTVTTDDDYLQMDNVDALIGVNPDKDGIKQDPEILPVAHTRGVNPDGLGDSGDYVLPDTCISDPITHNKNMYTKLELNFDDNIYATVNKKPKSNCNKIQSEENIYANSTSALYDDFDNLTENDVLPRDGDNIYEVPPVFPKPVDQVTNNAANFKPKFKTSKATGKDYYQFSVQEVVQCLRACALPRLASICEAERLDGHFFENFDESAMIKEPFLLNWFHIAKLRRVISGWRPKH